MLGGSGDLVSKDIRTLIGVVSIATLFIITLATKSRDPIGGESFNFLSGSGLGFRIKRLGYRIKGSGSTVPGKGLGVFLQGPFDLIGSCGPVS